MGHLRKGHDGYSLYHDPVDPVRLPDDEAEGDHSGPGPRDGGAKSLLTCSVALAYGSVTVTVKDLMRFADQLVKAGADCRAKLDAVKRLVEAQ